MSPQAIADPQEIEQFARNLQNSNAQLSELTSRLKSQFHNLGQTWRDQEFHKFEQQFQQAMHVLDSYLQASNTQVPQLQRKAKILRDYLNQH